jgi:hypothetical protein
LKFGGFTENVIGRFQISITPFFPLNKGDFCGNLLESPWTVDSARIADCM